ncbi:hypothetical protein E2C01_029999 [Portunus trituberculatus]|uniref:Uncharacterized protein n=1 Tax=Portunus trituberculatus TaxID=210409 RepID=A0A5B7ETJ5_PORTR|nr:hypothetical protein [Portunus trituberculatus]
MSQLPASLSNPLKRGNTSHHAILRLHVCPLCRRRSWSFAVVWTMAGSAPPALAHDHPRFPPPLSTWPPPPPPPIPTPAVTAASTAQNIGSDISV